MTIRTTMIAANWKMNPRLETGRQLLRSILMGLPHPLTCEVIVAPPFTHLEMLRQETDGTPLQIAAQNCHAAPSGAFTGEISLPMLADLGVSHVITGHSERRQGFGETNEIVRDKVDAILAAGMTPIFCCGEPLAVREAGEPAAFVFRQLMDSLFHLPAAAMAPVIIAYEPIWAIGTGITATPEQAQEMHAFIRKMISRQFDDQLANSIRILYGGSIKADNAETLLACPDVDGGLVGGASLSAESFLAILRAACG